MKKGKTLTWNGKVKGMNKAFMSHKGIKLYRVDSKSTKSFKRKKSF